MKKRSYIKKHGVNTYHKYSLQTYTKIIEETNVKQDKLSNEKVYYCDLELSEYRYQFDSNENIYLAIAILSRCLNNNLYPPINVLNYLSLNLSNYLNSDKSLDNTFEASNRNKNLFNKNNRDKFIVIEIIKLQRFFDIGLEDAIFAVDQLMEYKGEKLEAETIKDIYNRHGKKLIEKTLMYTIDDLDAIDEMSQDFRHNYAQKLLSSYPKDIQQILIKKVRVNTTQKTRVE
jgi:hypothetical protein